MNFLVFLPKKGVHGTAGHPSGQELSCNKWGCCRLWKFVAECRELVLYMLLQQLTQLPSKAWLQHNFIHSEDSIHAPCSNLIFWRQVWMWVVKCTTSPFNSFHSNASKQVAGFSFPFYCSSTEKGGVILYWIGYTEFILVLVNAIPVD